MAAPSRMWGSVSSLPHSGKSSPSGPRKPPARRGTAATGRELGAHEDVLKIQPRQTEHGEELMEFQLPL